MTYTTSIDPQGRIYVRKDGEKFLVVGRVDQPHAQMWADWYAERLNLWQDGDGPPAWPIVGLQSFATDENVLFVYNGLPVATIGWNGGEWWFYVLSELGTVHGPEHINVDPDMTKHFQNERMEIAKANPSIVDVLEAEYEGRLRVFRDDTFPMAMMYGRSKARRIGIHRCEDTQAL